MSNAKIRAMRAVDIDQNLEAAFDELDRWAAQSEAHQWSITHEGRGLLRRRRTWTVTLANHERFPGWRAHGSDENQAQAILKALKAWRMRVEVES